MLVHNARDKFIPDNGSVEVCSKSVQCPSPFTMTSPSTAASITALLNSLHTHLQSQTQLLPTLHAQLGLSASALEDDLRILQKELLSRVEIQVEKRRNEVEQWMERCVDVEEQCIRYTR